MSRQQLVLIISLSPWLIVSSAFMERMTRENGPVEMTGAVLFMAAGVLFGASAWDMRGKWVLRARRGIVFGFLALVFVLSSLEEISWGQQIFGWGTPDAFSGNTQGETNLHNFSVFDRSGEGWLPIRRVGDGSWSVDLQRSFTLGVLGLAVVIPLLAAWKKTAGVIRALGLPVAGLTVSAWLVANFVVYRWVLRGAFGDEHRAIREYMEMLWAVAAVWVAIASRPQRETFYSSQAEPEIEPEAASGFKA